MTLNEIRFQIMSQATEDFTGLWELAGAERAATVDELIDVLSSLVQERLVAVYRGTHFASEEITLPTTSARREIRNKQFWIGPHPSKDHIFGFSRHPAAATGILDSENHLPMPG